MRKREGIGGITGARVSLSSTADRVNGSDILHQVKNRHPIAYWRQQTGAIGSEKQIAFAIDRSQQIGELQHQCQQTRSSHLSQPTYLEIRLHGGQSTVSCLLRSVKKSSSQTGDDKKSGSNVPPHRDALVQTGPSVIRGPR